MRASSLILLLGLTACSFNTGPAPSASQSQASRDLNACRQDADSRMSPTEYIPPGQEQASNNNQLMMQNYTVQKHYDSMVTDCLQSKGEAAGK